MIKGNLSFDGMFVRSIKGKSEKDLVNIINPMTVRTIEELLEGTYDYNDTTGICIVRITRALPTDKYMMSIKDGKFTITSHTVLDLENEKDELFASSIIRKNVAIIRPLVSGVQILGGGFDNGFEETMTKSEFLLIRNKMNAVNDILNGINIATGDDSHSILLNGDIIISIADPEIDEKFSNNLKKFGNLLKLTKVQEALRNSSYEVGYIKDGNITSISAHRIEGSYIDGIVTVTLKYDDGIRYENLSPDNKKMVDEQLNDYLIGTLLYVTEREEMKKKGEGF